MYLVEGCDAQFISQDPLFGVSYKDQSLIFGSLSKSELELINKCNDIIISTDKSNRGKSLGSIETELTNVLNSLADSQRVQEYDSLYDMYKSYKVQVIDILLGLLVK